MIRFFLTKFSPFEPARHGLVAAAHVGESEKLTALACLFGSLSVLLGCSIWMLHG
jgi:hypothetical protein